MAANSLGAVLTDLRKKRGLSQEEMGYLLGIEPSSISRYETGDRLPTLMTLRKLATRLAVTAPEMMELAVAAFSGPPRGGRTRRTYRNDDRTRRTYKTYPTDY